MTKTSRYPQKICNISEKVVKYETLAIKRNRLKKNRWVEPKMKGILLCKSVDRNGNKQLTHETHKCFTFSSLLDNFHVFLCRFLLIIAALLNSKAIDFHFCAKSTNLLKLIASYH